MSALRNRYTTIQSNVSSFAARDLKSRNSLLSSGLFAERGPLATPSLNGWFLFHSFFGFFFAMNLEPPQVIMLYINLFVKINIRKWAGRYTRPARFLTRANFFAHRWTFLCSAGRLSLSPRQTLSPRPHPGL